MLHPPHTGHPRARRPWNSAFLLLTTAAIIGGGTGIGSATGCNSRSAGTGDGDVNVLLIVVDTLGAHQLGTYEPAMAPTPHLDALAAGGVRFDRAYATAPWTQPSLASIFTARMPSTHRVQNIRDVLRPEEETLAERLGLRGYRTHGVVSHHLIGADLGYAQGFERYDESAVAGHDAVTSDRVTDLAIEAIDERGDAPFFLFAHYFDPHYAYRHHAGFDRTSSYAGRLAGVDDIWDILALRPELDAADIGYLRGRHQEEVAFVDLQVGRLLDHLTASGLDDSTVVVFVADHGEEFMEHGWIGHTRTLYEELIRVPLIVRIPGRTLPLVVDSPVSTLDILPTLLELAGHDGKGGGGAAPDVVEGRSWLPFLSGERPWPTSREIVAEVNFMPPSARQQEKLAFKTALILGEMKVVHDRTTGAWELYRLSADPTEQHSIAGDKPGAMLELTRKLLEWERGRELPTEFTLALPEGLSDEELERLRSLGYIQ